MGDIVLPEAAFFRDMKWLRRIVKNQCCNAPMLFS